MQTRMIDNEVKMMRQENLRLGHERDQMVDKIQDNTTKIKQNKVLPYLVSKVVEILDVDAEAQEGAAHNEHNAKKSKCAVIKTSTRQVSRAALLHLQLLFFVLTPDRLPPYHRSCTT